MKLREKEEQFKVNIEKEVQLYKDKLNREYDLKLNTQTIEITAELNRDFKKKLLELQHLHQLEKQEISDRIMKELETHKIDFEYSLETKLNRTYSDKIKLMEEDFTVKLETFANETKFDLQSEPIIIEKMKELEQEYENKINDLQIKSDEIYNKQILDNEKLLINKYENIYLDKNNQLEIKYFRRLADKILELENQYKNLKNLI